LFGADPKPVQPRLPGRSLTPPESTAN
jgi:hypothetical protein